MTTAATYNLQHRKEAILNIAEEVFAEHSFAGASIRLIAKRSAINSAMISYYFGSKERLYQDIFKLRLGAVAQEIGQFDKVDLNPAEKLEGYLTAYIARIASATNFHRLLSNELVSTYHPCIIAQMREARKRIYDFLLKTIETGIAEGTFKKVDKEVLVLDILALVRSAFTDQLNIPVDLDSPHHEQLAQRIVKYIMSIVLR